MQFDTPPPIEFDQVHFAYGDIPVLRDLSFVFEPGSFLGVIGPNGAGKTTMLRLLTGLQHPSRGTVRIAGTSVTGIAPRTLARTLAVVPQNESIAFPYSVASMILLGRFPHTGFLGFERPEDLRVAQEAMRLVGIDHLADRAVADLSGGEQHRVFIARALAQQTPVLLLDEPSAHLDIHYQVSLFELLARMHRDEGRSVLIITHDLNLAGMFCDRILLLDDGQAAAWGTPADVLREDILTRHFSVNISIDPGERPHVRILRD